VGTAASAAAVAASDAPRTRVSRRVRFISVPLLLLPLTG
jgi:hypothetical protein